MRYRVALEPIDPSQLTQKSVDSSGVTHQRQVTGEFTPGGVKTLAEATAQIGTLLTQYQSVTNWGPIVTEALVGGSAPSAGQMAAVITYLQAIRAGTVTTTVETAINAL